MMDLLKKRGAGTCDEGTECATGCVPYPFAPTRPGSAQGIPPFMMAPQPRCSWDSKGYDSHHCGSHDFNSERNARTSTLSSMCPFQCDGTSGQCNPGKCADGGTIYHYHDLEPTCFAVPGLPMGSIEEKELSADAEEAIMREIWTNGPVAATMAIYHSPFEKYNELESTMMYGGVYKKNSGSAKKAPPSYHAVKIVGWGVENEEGYAGAYGYGSTGGSGSDDSYDDGKEGKTGTAYWKVANSWGTEVKESSFSFETNFLSYPEKGYFRIKRGSNFCGIESTICYASALTGAPGTLPKAGANHTWRKELAKIPSSHAPGGWAQIPSPASHHGLQGAISHYAAHGAHARKRRASEPNVKLSTNPADFTVKHAQFQATLGVNYHVTMESTDQLSGDRYALETVIHRNLHGKHEILSDRPPHKAVPVEISSKSAQSSSDSGAIVTLIWVGSSVAGAAMVALVIVGLVRNRHGSRASGDVSCQEDQDARPRTSSQEQVIHMQNMVQSGNEAATSTKTAEPPTMGNNPMALVEKPRGRHERSASTEKEPSSTLLI